MSNMSKYKKVNKLIFVCLLSFLILKYNCLQFILRIIKANIKSVLNKVNTVNNNILRKIGTKKKYYIIKALLVIVVLEKKN
jgi:hypothetical protein